MTSLYLNRYTVIACALLAVCGCSSKAPASGDDHLRDRIANERAVMRAESVKAWADKTVDGQPILQHLQRRTALLWLGAVSLDLGPPNESGTRAFVAQTSDGSSIWKVASAVAVAQEGYFLTVAHGVTKEADVMLLVPQENSPPLEVQGRVVWTGWNDARESGRGPDNQDMALVYAPIDTNLPVMAWANPAEAKAGTAVLACGAGATSVRVSAGKVTDATTEAVKGPAPPNRWKFAPMSAVTTITTDLPLVPGDSGGPVVTEEGQLIGIGTRTSSDSPVQSFVLRPDLKWLTSAIETHRQAIAGSEESLRPRARLSMAGFTRLAQAEAAVENVIGSNSR